MNLTCSIVPVFAKERVLLACRGLCSRKIMVFVLVTFVGFILIAIIYWALNKFGCHANSCMCKFICNPWNNPTRYKLSYYVCLTSEKTERIRDVKKFVQIHKTDKRQRQVSNSGLLKPIVLTTPLTGVNYSVNCFCFVLFY